MLEVCIGAGSLRAVAEEIGKFKSDLVEVQEVRWDRSGTEPAGEYTFFYGKGNGNHKLGRWCMSSVGMFTAQQKIKLIIYTPGSTKK
jgi:hypothetical protein